MISQFKSPRIYIVFDQYFTSSIKDCERLRRNETTKPTLLENQNTKQDDDYDDIDNNGSSDNDDDYEDAKRDRYQSASAIAYQLCTIIRRQDSWLTVARRLYKGCVFAHRPECCIALKVGHQRHRLKV
ncbi:hypothetical protein TNCV_4472521 [Trichonephila clavipes]|uniref:Uncharacterized protein n=1 Tax=Trichonephila clavipes TaxID=2585209 RepID=A0A8X6SFH0_TRICX|nr:hypothetical protein TNCV_4472521 [Trichonephila clavipes]